MRTSRSPTSPRRAAIRRARAPIRARARARSRAHRRAPALRRPRAAPRRERRARARRRDRARRRASLRRAARASPRAKRCSREVTVRGAREHLESALVLSDLDPASGQRAAAAAARSLRRLARAPHRAVHAYADEVLREDPAWRFQLRMGWLAVSQALEPLLGVRFVVVELGTFQSAGAGFDLPPILAAGRRRTPKRRRPAWSCFATGRPSPRAARLLAAGPGGAAGPRARRAPRAAAKSRVACSPTRSSTSSAPST